MKPSLRGFSKALPALFLLVTGACRVCEAKVHNLRELHEADGSYRRVADLQGDLEYLLGQAFSGIGLSAPGFLGTKGDEIVDDPPNECLENLNGLGKCDVENRWVRASQAELFSWLAIDDPSAFVRERAFLFLGPLGQRLEVTGPARIEEADEPLDPTRVAELLARLIQAARPLFDREESDDDRERLVVVCREAGDALYDMEGARRQLRAVTTLLGGSSANDSRLVALYELQDRLGRRCIELALGNGLLEPDPRTRASAVEASVVAAGAFEARLLRAALGDREPPVVRRTLQMVARYGLPVPPPDLDAQERERIKLRWYQDLVLKTQSLDGPTSVAACKALARVTDADIDSIRPELWARWWDEILLSNTDLIEGLAVP